MPAFINNSGINYSLYYNVLDYFKDIMKNHPSIAYVSQGDLYDIDTKEFPQYPIGNILISSAKFEGSTTIYKCQLLVADKVKDKNNNSDGVYNKQVIPYYGTDDIVDIHANSLSIINDLLSFTADGTTNFSIPGAITCNAFANRYDNGLAGFVADFELLTFNDRPKCEFNLLSQSDINAQVNC